MGNSHHLMRDEFDKRTQPGEFDKVWNGSTTIYEIEDAFNRVYYNRTDHVQLQIETSGIHHLEKVKNTPILVLKSQNDPIIGDTIDEDKLMQNANIVLAKTRFGGHLGFY